MFSLSPVYNVIQGLSELSTATSLCSAWRTAGRCVGGGWLLCHHMCLGENTEFVIVLFSISSLIILTTAYVRPGKTHQSVPAESNTLQMNWVFQTIGNRQPFAHIHTHTHTHTYTHAHTHGIESFPVISYGRPAREEKPK